MKDYAVIKTGGKQYPVSPGDKVKIDRIAGEKGQAVKFEQVLLLKVGSKLTIGQPVVKGKTVKAKIISQEKDKKIRVAKFRAKSRYRRVKGHRQPVTRVEILPF